MELTKRVIPGKYDSVFYLKKGEIVNPADCVLLGFKDNLPVLSSRMEATKGHDFVGKTLRVEVDSQTGEKYIQLNGKKLKMVTESELSSQFKTNGLIGTKPMKVKILGSLPSVLGGPTKIIKNPDVDKTTFKLNINTSRDNSCCTDNGLSQKPVLINECKVPFVKNPTGIASTSQSRSVKDEMNFNIAVNKLGLTKTYRAVTMKTIELKQSAKKVDKSVQTDTNKLVSQHVQTDLEKDTLFNGALHEELSNLSGLDLMELFNINSITSPFPQVEQAPAEAPPNVKLAESRKVQLFFHDLKTALQPDDKGNMPIHVAVLKNNLNDVKRCCNILRALQKPVDIFNHGDLTALQLAILNDIDPEIIKMLLSNGASLGVTDCEDNNILHLAVELERKDVLQIILKTAEARDFNLNQFNAEGLTPLMICCLNKFIDCADILLQFHADPNIQDRKSGRTALFHAAELHDAAMVQLLLNHNADTKIKNFFGTSPHDAMYEVDDIPEQIRAAILGRNLKRKAVDDPKILKTILKTRHVEENTKQLKTYARFKKINDYEFKKNVTAK